MSANMNMTGSESEHTGMTDRDPQVFNEEIVEDPRFWRRYAMQRLPLV